MFKRQIAKMVQKEIAQNFETKLPKPPEGYLPLELIRGALFLWEQVPFNGKTIWCQLRCPNGSQLQSRGSVTLIKLAQDHKAKKIDTEKLIEIRNIQEGIVRDTLNNPSFDEIETLIFNEDNVMSKQKKELEEIRKIDLSTLEQDKAKELISEMDRLELATSFVLPEDAFSFLTSWGLGLDVSDIKDITEDMLIEAASLAKLGHDNPTDHISGVSLTDRDKTDIDKTAWGLFGDLQHKKQVEQQAMRGKRR